MTDYAKRLFHIKKIEVELATIDKEIDNKEAWYNATKPQIDFGFGRGFPFAPSYASDPVFQKDIEKQIDTQQNSLQEHMDKMSPFYQKRVDLNKKLTDILTIDL